MGGAGSDKAACHSDLTNPEEANLLQVKKLDSTDAIGQPQSGVPIHPLGRWAARLGSGPINFGDSLAA